MCVCVRIRKFGPQKLRTLKLIEQKRLKQQHRWLSSKMFENCLMDLHT